MAESRPCQPSYEHPGSLTAHAPSTLPTVNSKQPVLLLGLPLALDRLQTLPSPQVIWGITRQGSRPLDDVMSTRLDGSPRTQGSSAGPSAFFRPHLCDRRPDPASRQSGAARKDFALSWPATAPIYSTALLHGFRDVVSCVLDTLANTFSGILSSTTVPLLWPTIGWPPLGAVFPPQPELQTARHTILLVLSDCGIRIQTD